MKTLYLECGMGAAGDMLMAALLELIPDKQAFIDKMNTLNLPSVHVEAEKAVKCGITGTHMDCILGQRALLAFLLDPLRLGKRRRLLRFVQRPLHPWVSGEYCEITSE